MSRVWIEDRAEHADYRERVAAAKKAKRTPPGRWRVRWYNPAGKLKTKTVGTVTEADAAKRDVERQLDSGTYRDPAAGKVKVRDVADAWFTAQVQLKDGSKNVYRDALDDYVLPQWGARAVASVRFEEVAAWIAKLESEPGKKKASLGPATIRMIHLVFLMVMEWAVKSGKIAVNPARDVPLPRLPMADHVYLTHVEVEVLATAAGEYRPLILFLAYTGLRWGEASALTVGRLDLEARRAHVVQQYTDNKGTLSLDTPKTHERRQVPIPAFLVDELRPLVEGRDADALVFTAPRGGPLWLRTWRPRYFNKALAKAGLSGRKVTPHKLRHTAASLAIAAGADVLVIQKMLGHAKPSITLDTYGHLFPDRLDEVAEAVDARRAGALSGAAEKQRTAEAA
ncbi:tyrosine-type recombinase/integrase [Allonocardiopsis opalescens]|uniref:Site-specific recombinase XerD n=1 Tax=Allonocardiopsis opalescens TaxID=1144618 RepID=A0A2T0QA64_9ACTN|nr:site-specific integrase [Allonocardiopsis opalescens]PRY00701.1 site-specific recombinase XerD [Allonocardiopsis opalescens]